MRIPVSITVTSRSGDAESVFVDTKTQPIDMTLYLEFPDRDGA
jgi:hypothetical protein